MFMMFVGLVIGFVLLMDARSKIGRLEMRLRLLERGNVLPIEVEAEPVIERLAEPIFEPITEPTPQPIPEPIIKPAPVAKPVFKIPSWTFNFEDLFGRKLPIWAGGITLAIAGVLIAKYAIDAGMMKIFTPWVRVVGGLVFGLGLIAGAEWAMRQAARVDDPRIRQALSGAGIATLYATVLVAANVYTLIGPFAAFVALAMVTASAMALSIRFGAPSAVLGLAGGLAAPAMVSGAQPNVPMLAVYLALTIAGLAGVSRMQRWAWLGIIALAGGAGWSLWMIVASSAFDTTMSVGASLSVGGLVLLLAIGVPMLVIRGPRAALFRSATTLVGAAQLALMVALGGFTMLNWGLFALLATAGQWLNWRERGFATVPTIGLVLSVGLLIGWPHPLLSNFVMVGLALAIIHGGPLMLTVWKTPPVLRKMVELCGLAFSVLVVSALHYYPFFWHVTPRDIEFSLVSLMAGLIPATALALGWTRDDRHDRRFALATATAAALFGIGFCFATPDWLWPIGIAVIGAAILFFSEAARDGRGQVVAAVYAAVSIPLLAMTGIATGNDWDRLAGVEHEIAEPMAALRWAVLTAAAAVFAVRARPRLVAKLAQIVAAFVGYGAVAQIVPVTWLPLVPPVALAGLAAAHSRLVWPRLASAAGALAVLIAAWAIGPVAIWLGEALASVGGVPMVINPAMLTWSAILKQMLTPAVLIGVSLWCWRGQMGKIALRGSVIGAGVLATVAVHALYRIGFAHAVGSDFTDYGLAQRIVWEALLIIAGWLVSMRYRRAGIVLIAAGALHTFWYTLLLHNPLWATQAVGGLPVLNWIAPAVSLLFGGAVLLRTMLPGKAERAFQLLVMVLVAGFAWATLRQAFHGTLLVEPGVSGTEDILRSILAIGLAIGFLLWGIRTQQRDWRIASLVLLIGAVGKVFLFDASGLEGLLRIASFVALGFSLIGIGWLYSRQLTHDAGLRVAET